MIDNNLRLSAIHKDGHQVIQRTVVLYGLNLRSGYHTVAHLSVGKVQSILENLHFLVDIVLILSVINTRLHQIVEVHFRKCIVVFLLLYLKAKDAEDNPGKHRTETRNGPKHHIAEIGRYSKDGKQPVWIALEESLWQEFTRKEHYQSGKNRVCRDGKCRVHSLENRVVEELRNQYAIDNQCNIVAYEHRAYEIVGMMIEVLKQPAGKTLLVFIHLSKHTVTRHKGNLHARKEGREDHRDDDSDYD